MIPEYNQIDIKNDTVDVIKKKLSAIKEAYQKGEVSKEDVLEEKKKLQELEKDGEHLVGYAFTWL